MARTPKDVTDAELAILEVLWRRDCATVREIAEEIYPAGGNSKSATVQKLCERLLSKQCVARNGSVRPATYLASVAREELIGRQLEDVANKLCAGSLTPLFSSLVESASLSQADLEALREQVERAQARVNGAAKREDCA